MYQILPWDDGILDAPEEWLDWALNMQRLYPDPLVFESTEEVEVRTQGQKVNVGWANVLLGQAKEKFMARFRPTIIPKQDTITRV